MATARSSGMFPRQAAWVDLETLLPDDGSLKTVPNLLHSEDVNIVAYFSASAVGSVAIKRADNSVIATIAAPSGGGKVVIERGGVEVGAVTQVKLDKTLLTAGTVQVSLF